MERGLFVCWMMWVVWLLSQSYHRVSPHRVYIVIMPYEFTARELQDLIDGLPRVLHLKHYAPIRVRLLGVKEMLRRRKFYRHTKTRRRDQRGVR